MQLEFTEIMSNNLSRTDLSRNQLELAYERNFQKNVALQTT